jgi:hypothetical protein
MAGSGSQPRTTTFTYKQARETATGQILCTRRSLAGGGGVGGDGGKEERTLFSKDLATDRGGPDGSVLITDLNCDCSNSSDAVY